jgi:hypothetical protein
MKIDIEYLVLRLPNNVHRPGFGLLCLSINCISSRHCNITIYMDRYIMVRFDMAITGAIMGNTSFLHLCRSIRQEGTTIAGIVSCVFLLLALGVVDTLILKEDVASVNA